MMLSVIIVNYNVKHFLEQALTAVFHSKVNFNFDVFVVDNNSADGSVEMVKTHFPQVHLMAERENHGFSKANNLAIKASMAKYVLLLNPDTVIETDTLQKSVDFMERTPDAGGLGVKMIDGRGNFLPESKRGFPSPMVAFYKMTGLSTLFPHSTTFGKYHLSYLDKNTIHEVEVLSGAFMLLRKSVLDDIGLLDEAFFMYGEDIDLSYRIVQAGYKNYYFPTTKIIHFKGESTRKGSLNYVKVFYQAMIIFLEKHFHGTGKGALVYFLKIGIYLRAMMAVGNRIISRLGWTLLDALFIFIGLFFTKEFWENVVKIKDKVTYPPEFLYVNVPLYISIWLLSIFFSGGYDKNIKYWKIFRGLTIGTILIAAVYGFLSMKFRFSRGMILVGFVWASLFTFFSRLLYFSLKGKSKSLFTDVKRLMVAGSREEAERIVDLLKKVGVKKEFLGFVSTHPEDEQAEAFLGKPEKITEIAGIMKPDEIIFCSSHLSSNQIISYMTVLEGIDFKIAPQEGAGIIGSNSKNTAGDLYTIDISFKINNDFGKRNKRLIDILLSLLFLATSPIFILINRRKSTFLSNIFYVLIGKKSWVGYDKRLGEEHKNNLPKIKMGVLSPLDILRNSDLEEEIIRRAHLIYAKEYSGLTDLMIVFKNLTHLDKQ